MTEEFDTATFDAALESRGITPSSGDHAAALRIARFLEGCVRLLREAEEEEPDEQG